MPGQPPAQPQPGAPGQPQPPQTYAPQLSRSAGTRVSLTGEVIDDNAGSAPPPSYVGGGQALRPPVGAPPRTGGPASARAAYGAPRSEAPAKSSGGIVVAVLAGLLVLGGLGAGGWWFLTPHTTPKMVVQKFDTAIGAQDWKAVYPLVELSPDIKAKCPDATAFASYMTAEMDKARSVPMGGGVVDGVIKAYQTAQVGEQKIEGDSATVPITLKLSIAVLGMTSEKAIEQQIPLHKVNGAWKIDSLKSAIPGGVGPGGG